MKYCSCCGAIMENNGNDDDDLQAGERFYNFYFLSFL